MYTLLLIVIYLVFISLGLPDSLLGSAWPVMQAELGAPLSRAGVISLIITSGTVISSLLSGFFISRFKTYRVTWFSVLLTAVALFGFSMADSFWMLCFWALPYGLGAGSIDSALNGYIALHFKPRHMSWLHCFWGVGCSVGPLIMSRCILSGAGWRGGYRTIAIIQSAITLIAVISKKLWREDALQAAEESGTSSLKTALQQSGARALCLAFFCYCSVETTCGLWASSYLVSFGMSAETVSALAAMFYIGITVGRLLSGFATWKLKAKTLVFLGEGVTLAAIACMLLTKSAVPAAAGILLIGFGCAPVYPNMIQSTPERFGRENCQVLVGLQMASAYTGSLLMPPLFGLLAEKTGMFMYPYFLLFFQAALLLCCRKVFSGNLELNA